MKAGRTHISKFILQYPVWGFIEALLLHGYKSDQIAQFMFHFFVEIGEHYADDPHACDNLSRLLRYHMQDKLTFELPIDILNMSYAQMEPYNKVMAAVMAGMPKKPTAGMSRAQ